jgi:Tfp pilus assembly ATPase PilU
MQGGRALGMQTMNMSLYELVMAKKITEEEALNHTTEPNDLRRMLSLDTSSKV